MLNGSSFSWEDVCSLGNRWPSSPRDLLSRPSESRARRPASAPRMQKAYELARGQYVQIETCRGCQGLRLPRLSSPHHEVGELPPDKAATRNVASGTFWRAQSIWPSEMSTPSTSCRCTSSRTTGAPFPQPRSSTRERSSRRGQGVQPPQVRPLLFAFERGILSGDPVVAGRNFGRRLDSAHPSQANSIT